MSHFKDNPTDFSAECVCRDGKCTISSGNILFLERANDLDAVDRLQWQCGFVVIAPDETAAGRSLLYHMSCQRMSDVVAQIFEDALGAPTALPQYPSPEMSLGELRRHPVALPWDACRDRVEAFDFSEAVEG